DSTITGEGIGLTASASVKDNADNQTDASSPAVKIDRHAPNTNISAPSEWTNADATVSLSAADNLSDVKATYFSLDGAAPEIGTSIDISAEGIHTIQFWSEDNAGNVESVQTAQVKIDKTAPTINHTQAPPANAHGWNNGDVTVSFICNDSDAGIASCT